MCGGGQYREKLILNVTVFYREELILNITVFVVSVCWRAIYRGTDTECYCVCCECVLESNIERN